MLNYSHESYANYPEWLFSLAGKLRTIMKITGVVTTFSLAVQFVGNEEIFVFYYTVIRNA